MRERETEHTMSHHVRLAGKLAKRLGIARAHARDWQRRFDEVREKNFELRCEVAALREANRRLNELLDKREAPRPTTVESGFAPGTPGW